MKKNSALILPLIVILMLSPLLLFSQAAFTSHTGVAENPTLMSVHVFNLSSKQEEEQLLNIFKDFNTLFNRMGYPTVRYRLWKTSGKQSGEFNYRWDSIWPTQAIYDKIQGSKEFQDLVEKHRGFLEKVIKKELFNRYVELQVDAKHR